MRLALQHNTDDALMPRGAAHKGLSSRSAFRQSSRNPPACRFYRQAPPRKPPAWGECRQRDQAVHNAREWPHQHCDIEPVIIGVIATHNPLQFGKFIYHARHQISLHKARRHACRCSIGTQKAAQLSGQLFQPHGFFRHRAEPGMKHDFFQSRQPGFK